MRLLLTSAGVKNPSIHDTLLDLLRRPIADCTALAIPTATYGHPMTGPGASAWKFIAGRSNEPMIELGWKSVGVLELTALPSIPEEKWVPLVREADVLLVSGGDALYLNHWMRESGFTDLVPSLTNTLYMGMSAGSMVTTARWGSSTSRSSRTSTIRCCHRTPWALPSSGRPGSAVRRTRSTTRPRSWWTTATSTSSPRGTGSTSPPTACLCSAGVAVARHLLHTPPGFRPHHQAYTPRDVGEILLNMINVGRTRAGWSTCRKFSFESRAVG